MKFVIVATLLLSIFSGCSSPSANSSEDVSEPQTPKSSSLEESALRQIFNKISKLRNTTFTGKQILISDSSITLNTSIEFDSQKENNWIYAVAFNTTCNFDKATNINVSSIGIGSNASEAKETCIQEWLATFGVAFTGMLQDSNSIAFSNMKVFPGYMGIRGDLPKNTWLKGDDKMTKRIISAITNDIHNTDNLAAIDIKLMIKDGNINTGECRLNNRVSIDLLNDLKQLKWPVSENGFLFKQFYLIKKSGAQYH